MQTKSCAALAPRPLDAQKIVGYAPSPPEGPLLQPLLQPLLEPLICPQEPKVLDVASSSNPGLLAALVALAPDRAAAEARAHGFCERWTGASLEFVGKNAFSVPA